MAHQDADFQIGDNDLLDYIEQLSIDIDNTGDDGTERPAKRIKTAPAVDYVTIHRETLSFSSLYTLEERSPLRSLNKQNVEQYLKLSRPSGAGLSISSREKFRKRTVRAAIFSASYPVSEELAVVLDIAENNGKGNTEPSRFWTSISIQTQYQDGQVTVDFTFELRWNECAVVPHNTQAANQRNTRDRILQVFAPKVHTAIQSQRASSQNGLSAHDFYEAAFVTNRDDVETMSIHVPRLTADLFPFQKRAIQWLLCREGVRWSANASDDAPGVLPVQLQHAAAVPSHFIETKDADNKACFVSDLFGVVTRDPTPFTTLENGLMGGILAEEMGLGKTVEIISLILLHKRPAEDAVVWDDYLETQVRPTSATLIVTPPSLKQQWLSELDRHAPQLRVMAYSGIGKSCKDDASEKALVNQLAHQDVVVTTYNELQKELHFALNPPDRSMRGQRRHHRPKSPLVQLSWWRVCLDEAQEVENGVSNAATLARIIPRVNAWGVTGTPVKDGVKDLWGLLLFLRYQPYASAYKVWETLISSHKSAFDSLFNRIALRHTKRLVRDELELPPQKRYVINMPFTAVEEQHYQSLFLHLTRDAGLDIHGQPRRDDWNPDSPAVLEAMRTALDRLRQTALHPEVGGRNRRALGNKSSPMRTVAEVLDAMMEQSENAITVDQRALLSTRLTQGQLLENSPRVKEALAIWEAVLTESDDLVRTCREQLRLQVEQAQSNEGASSQANERDDWEEDPDAPVSAQVGEAQRKLRYALEIQHKAVFFCANAHFQIKSDEDLTEPGSDEFKRLEALETDGYERAKAIRREILRESYGKATHLMMTMAAKVSTQAFVSIDELRTPRESGIESRAIIAAWEHLGYALNQQANQLDDWREQIIQLLVEDLVDEEDDIEITGDEYGDSTKVQEDLIAYITVLRVAIADRHAALSGLALSKLTEDEIKHAVNLAYKGDGPSPEKLLQLAELREKVQPVRALGSLRGLITDFRDLATKLKHQANNGNSRASAELAIATSHLKDVQHQLTQQTKASSSMEQEIDRFTTTMNARVEYYRQLQAVSDSVGPYEGLKDDYTLARLAREERALARQLEMSQSKHRYLQHLKDVESNEEQRTCIICTASFSVGVLTVCGHQFCKTCITHWLRAHHNCPMCKRPLKAANLHDITFKPQELTVRTEGVEQAEAAGNQNSPRSKKTGIYADFSTSKLAEIKNIDLPGPSFTTKIDTLVRHLLWLRESDPGAKSILFSQYPEFLRIVATAFRRHQIGFTAFTDRDGIVRFKEDPAIECFLLHARAHSSGLNLVNASHVILCEPLLNTALELQAIARVDRIGQKHETTVWLYIVDGTVEESIYNLSVERRMDHMGRKLKGKSKESTPELMDSSLEAANALEMEEAQLTKLMSKKGRFAGEEVAKGDLWTCLFGNKKGPSQDTPAEDAFYNNPRIRQYLVADAAEARQHEVVELEPERRDWGIPDWDPFSRN